MFLQNNNFPILEFGWSANEEIKLLDALADCGPGNWDAIASQVESKSKTECEMHYKKCYVVNAKYPLPGEFLIIDLSLIIYGAYLLNKRTKTIYCCHLSGISIK